MKSERGKVANRIKKANRNEITSHHEVTTLDVKKLDGEKDSLSKQLKECCYFR